MISMRVPFNKPGLAGREMAYISEAVLSGHTSSGGPYTKRVEEILKTFFGSEDVLLTTSCTDALEMAAMLIDLGPGDVVIMPSFTFSSTATAFARTGAKIRFCDIEPSHLGLDVNSVAERITPDVKAIVTVHYAGVAGDVDDLIAISRHASAVLVEDNAHGLFAQKSNKKLGTFGELSTLSFHETKNFICGEGGALVINDSRYVDRAHILLDKGCNRKQFLEGQTDKYTWQDAGSSFGLSEILSAFLLAQIEEKDTISGRRRAAHRHYTELLTPIADELGFALPFSRSEDVQADHMFYVLLPPELDRNTLIKSMNADEVFPTFHYVPLHSAPASTEFADGMFPCPVTDDVSKRILRLPFFNEITRSMQEQVVESLVTGIERAKR